MAESDISLHDHGRSPAKNDAALTHARSLILRVCHIAGTAAFIDEAGLGPEGKDLRKAIRSRNTAALFDHLVAALSYQGISDEVAKNFMDRHGLASWHVIESALRRRPSCPKLRSYWHFYDCRYNKSRFTCAEPDHLADCPLPRSWLRNGRLNQTAYSLYLFVRDVADGDLVGWIDRRLNAADQPVWAGPAGTHASGAGRTAAGGLRGIRQSADDGAVATASRRTPFPTALARGRRQHDRGRYPRAQFSAPHRHPAAVRRRATAMAQPATDRTAAPRSSRPSPARSMPVSSTAGSRRRFRGSCSMRSGDTARSKVSTSATAIRSTTENHAKMYNAHYTLRCDRITLNNRKTISTDSK